MPQIITRSSVEIHAESFGNPDHTPALLYLSGDWELDQEMANNHTRALYETETIAPAWNHTNVQNEIPDIMAKL